MAFALATQDVERSLGLLNSVPFVYLQVDDVVVFDPTPVLALPGAVDHPASAVALMIAGWQAWTQGDDPGALDLLEQSLATEARLGPTPDSHLAMFTAYLRSAVANGMGAEREAVDQMLEAARHARADDLPAMTAWYLGGAVNNLGWLDPTTALALAPEGLALARQAGAPLAITLNLLSFAQALAPDDPDQARAMLDEAFQLEATLGYLDATPTFVYAAGRLGAWTATLRAASRTLKHQLRSGAATRVIVAGVMNLAARGLAEDRPEPAAVIQGAVHAVLRGVAAPTALPGLAVPPEPTAVVAFIAGARHDTTQLLIATLGEPRLRELRADGAAMTEDQAYTYARAHIDEYLAAGDRDSDG